MATEKQRLTFISYSRTNRGFALELAKELKASGFLIWFDQLDIPTGARWDDEIERALTQCEIFMVILTQQSIASNNVKDEIGYAIDSNKRILPILLERVNVPFRLRRFQYVDFTNKSNEEGIEAAKQLLRKLMYEPAEGRPESASTYVQSPQPEVDRSSALQADANRLARQKAEAIRNAREQEQRERYSQVQYQTPSPQERRPQKQITRRATPKLIPIMIGTSLLFLLCSGGGWLAWPYIFPATATSTITPTSTHTPIVPIPITDTQTMTMSVTVPSPSVDPVQFVVDYWSDVSERRYELAWQKLTPAFRQRSHNNDINDFMSGYEARNYCRIETSNGRLINNDGSIAVVSLQVIYYVGQSCAVAPHTFEITLVYNNADQMWQYEKTVEIQ